MAPYHRPSVQPAPLSAPLSALLSARRLALSLGVSAVLIGLGVGEGRADDESFREFPDGEVATPPQLIDRLRSSLEATLKSQINRARPFPTPPSPTPPPPTPPSPFPGGASRPPEPGEDPLTPRPLPGENPLSPATPNPTGNPHGNPNGNPNESPNRNPNLNPNLNPNGNPGAPHSNPNSNPGGVQPNAAPPAVNPTIPGGGLPNGARPGDPGAGRPRPRGPGSVARNWPFGSGNSGSGNPGSGEPGSVEPGGVEPGSVEPGGGNASAIPPIPEIPRSLPGMPESRPQASNRGGGSRNSSASSEEGFRDRLNRILAKAAESSQEKKRGGGELNAIERLVSRIADSTQNSLDRRSPGWRRHVARSLDRATRSVGRTTRSSVGALQRNFSPGLQAPGGGAHGWIWFVGLLGLAGAAAYAFVARRPAPHPEQRRESQRQALQRLQLSLRGIQSREDLVRAFDDYLQWRCGPPSRSWNSRVAERALAFESPEFAGQIAELVHLYQWSRYSPAGAPLPPQHGEHCRQILASLAAAASPSGGAGAADPSAAPHPESDGA